MIQYISRKKTLFRKLRKASITVPDEMLGYLMLRDANLSERARDVMETWTLGDYDFETIEKYLKKLEGPVPGNHGTHITGLAGLVEEGMISDTKPPFPGGDASVYPVECMDCLQEPEVMTFMTESLHLVPEDLNDEILEEMWKYIDDQNVIFVSGDIPDDMQFDEAEAVAICANYGQVR